MIIGSMILAYHIDPHTNEPCLDAKLLKKIVKNISVREPHWIWSNIRSPITNLPQFLSRQLLFRLPYNGLKAGTKLKITTHWPSDIYIARPNDYSNVWSEDTLKNDGWQLLPDTVSVNLYEAKIREACEILLHLWYKKAEKDNL